MSGHSLRRSPTRAAVFGVSLSVVAAALAGCGADSPTDTQTVELALIAGAEHGGAPFTTAMTQEVTFTPPWTGDADGVGTARVTVNPGQGEVCWEMTASNILLPATASHIHRAEAFVRGPIVVFLSPPDAAGDAAGCSSGIDRSLLQDILRNPSEFYVNVHTSDFPAGAIRGQLDRRQR